MSKTTEKQIEESLGYLSEFICSATYEMYEQVNIKIKMSPKLECFKKYFINANCLLLM